MVLSAKPGQWYLYNLDTDDQIQGQFVAESVTENIGAKWSERFALNRQHGIMQWLHGETRKVTFRARLFLYSEMLGKVDDPVKPLALLKSWTERDDELGRPPILSFWIGDAHLRINECVIEKISNISYKEPTDSGALRDVEFVIQLKEWFPYDIEFVGGDGETRYHNAAQNDYYEMLTFREYADPLMGDIIRKRHPTKPNVQIGDVIKLPSGDALSKDKVTQSSVQLKTGFGSKDTPQRRLAQGVFGRRTTSKVSHVVQEY